MSPSRDGTAVPAAIPALGTVCSLDADLPAILDDYAAGHCGAVDLWLGHAERFLAASEPERLRDLLAESGIRVVAASFQGGLLLADGEAGREHRTGGARSHHQQIDLGPCRRRHRLVSLVELRARFSSLRRLASASTASASLGMWEAIS